MIKKEIDKQVSKILQSEVFLKSKILSNFLRFIIMETLNGNEQSLKEYIIGVNVLKKDPDFNPQIDSIVRIHAGRLRKYLKSYYKELGRSDEIKITIPKSIALFSEFGTSSLNFKLRFWVPFEVGLTVKSDISVAIYNKFKELDIQIPFPQQDIYIKEFPKKK